VSTGSTNPGSFVFSKLSDGMIQRMDNVGIVVADPAAVTEFYV
jgi:hypothetical protein